MSANSKPPSGASLLFSAQSTKAVFTRSPGRSRRPTLILKDVARIAWLTDRPYRETGSWKPGRLAREWSDLYQASPPNAITDFSAGKQRGMTAFEMLRPKWNKHKKKLSFKLNPLDERQKDAITGLYEVKLSNVSLFIDGTTGTQPPWYPDGQNLNFTGVDFAGMNLSNASMQNSIISNTNLSNTNLSGANLFLSYGSGITGPFANFAGGVLISAVLEDSDLSSANLSNVNAQGVSFQGSNLSSASLQNSYLSQANFQYANLAGANLSGSNISGAQFYGATWDNTICPNGSLNSGSSACSGA